MGVRGLQSFLKDNRQSLCRSVILDSDGANERKPIPIVVDAWGVVYQLYLDSLPWTSGGEYFRFYQLSRRLIMSWRRVGLEPTFVFDGAGPEEKHTTLLDRLQQQVTIARLFYTISPATRSSPSFSRNETILPPFASHAFGRALASLSVSVRYVPLGEADGMCVVLADQLGGYVLGKDSDFVIYTAAASGALRGYCPLDMLMWIEGQSSSEQGQGSGSEFTTVTSGKRGNAGRTSPLLPPRRYRNPTLVLANYAPTALRSRLRLPASALPLFSSLAGNDYTPAYAAEVFFEPGAKPRERIELVARVLREQLVLASNVRSSTATNGDTAVDLVRNVVRKLSSRSYIDDQRQNQLVDAIIEATFQYSLPSSRYCCSTYPFCGQLDSEGCQTSLSRMSTPPSTTPSCSDSVRAFAAAQRRGLVPSVTHVWLYPKRVYLWSVLEDPSAPSTRASQGSRDIRQAAYKIVDETLAGLRWPAASEDELEAIREDLTLCELLGVTDIKGGRIGANSMDDETEHDVDMSQDSRNLPVGAISAPAVPMTSKRYVVEYVRQGSSNRVTGLHIEVHRPIPLLTGTPTTTSPPTSDAVKPLPMCLKPLADRLDMYLTHLRSFTPAVRALDPRLHPLIAVLRFCVTESAAASRKWRRSDVEAVLRAGLGSGAGWDASANDDGMVFDESDVEYPLLTTQSAVIVAQLSATMVDAHTLAQALLLLPDENKNENERLTHLMPYIFFSGVALHSLLAGIDPPPSTGWCWSSALEEKYKTCLAAVFDGLPEDVVGFTRPTGTRRSANANRPSSQVAHLQQRNHPNKDGNDRGRVDGKGVVYYDNGQSNHAHNHVHKKDVKEPVRLRGSRFDLLQTQ